MLDSPSLLGIIAALVMYAVSVSPSLLPRSWWWQSVVSGVLASLGYVVGVVIESAGTLILRLTDLTISASPATETGLRWAAFLIFMIWFIRSVVQSFIHARSAAQLVDMPGPRISSIVLGLLGAFVLFHVIIGVLDALLWMLATLVTFLARWIPVWIALAVGCAIIVALLILLTSKVIIAGGVTFFSRKAWEMNNRTAKGIFRPEVPERSGSHHSLVSWASVGGQGRVFLGRGPSRHDIEEVTGREALEPIRVYAGMPTGGQTLADAADMVVRELERTGAFERAVIAVNTSTGSGWVDEWEVQPLEYLTCGNCATASMQYSYAPSSLHWMTGLDHCVEAAIMLYQAVKKAVDGLPVNQRPALYITGESLGAFASQAVYTDLADVMRQVDGALWVGTPSFTPMHQELTEKRHRGSPEVAPVVDNARHVRFATGPEDLRHDIYGRELGPWHFPRIIYAQHPSDPVVWWTGRLAWYQPDWMREKAGRDVSPSMEYTRIGTYLQVLADLPVAGRAPGGHGHTYHHELIPMWKELLGLGDAERSNTLPDGQWADDAMLRRIGHAISANIALSERQ